MRISWLAGICLLGFAGMAQAEDPFNTTTDTFAVGSTNAFSLEFVEIGDPGNPPMPQGFWGNHIYGDVPYTYRIGQLEITRAQWAAFEREAGAPAGTPSTAYDQDAEYIADRPQTFMSWLEAAQFCNWLTTGDKSQGVYKFDGNNANPGNFQGVFLADGFSQSLNGTVYVMPTRSEWVKAGHWKPDGSGYSRFENGSDITIPWTRGIHSIQTHAQEQNGTYDMADNAQEWTEEWYCFYTNAYTLSNTRVMALGNPIENCTSVINPFAFNTYGIAQEAMEGGPFLGSSGYGLRVVALDNPAIPLKHGAPIFNQRGGRFVPARGEVGVPYIGGSVDRSARDSDAAEDASIMYSRPAGNTDPAWIIVNADGTLAGTPSLADIGRNTFRLRAENSKGGYDEDSFSVDVFEGAQVALVGWSGTSATADYALPGLSGSLILNKNNGSGARFMTKSKASDCSTDGTFGGEFPGAPASDGKFFAMEVWSGLEIFSLPYIELTITADAQPVFLGHLVWDWRPDDGIDYSYEYGVKYISGDLDIPDNLIIETGSPWLKNVTDNYASQQVSLMSRLTDRSLAPGESAAFRIYAGIDDSYTTAWIDNVAVVGYVPEPGYSLPEFSTKVITKSDGAVQAPYSDTLEGEATDADGDPLTYHKVDGPDWLTVSTNGTLSGTPGVLDWGTNTFTVSVKDDTYGEQWATLLINVDSAGKAMPRFTQEKYTFAGRRNWYFSETLSDKCSDGDGDTLTFSRISGDDWLNVAANGDLSGIPPAEGSGIYEFIVQVLDGTGFTNSVPVEIDVAENVVAWTEGVAGSPTLNRTPLSSTLSIDTGDKIVIAPSPAGGSDDNTCGTVLCVSSDLAGASFLLKQGWSQSAENSNYRFVINLSNTGSGVFDLEQFSFDGWREGSGSAKSWTLTYMSGDLDDPDGTPLGSGILINQKLALSGSFDFEDFDVPMTSLSDVSLAPGESAVFELSVTGQTAQGGKTFIDNIAIVGVPVDVSTNVAPCFLKDSFFGTSAIQGRPYAATLKGSASDPNGAEEALFYTKVNGPEWLEIAANGTLGGIPAGDDFGLNTFTVRVEDEFKAGDTAIFKIDVLDADDSCIVGWDSANTAPDYITNGVTGSVIGGSRNTDSTAVNGYNSDGLSWGSLEKEPLPTEDYTSRKLNGSANTVTITVDNTGSSPIALYGLHFDFLRRWSASFTDATVSYASGDLGNGPVQLFFASPGDPSANDQWCEVDCPIAGAYGDSVLSPGQSAVFRVVLSGPASNATYMDNIAVEYEVVASDPYPNGLPTPSFTSSLFTREDGDEEQNYSGTSLSGSATPANVGDPLYYSKSGGPVWLKVAPDGTLSGFPLRADVGLNNFIIKVEDEAGGFDTAALQITVNQAPNIAPVFTSAMFVKADGIVGVPYNDSLSGAATDANGDPLTYSRVSGPTWLNISGDTLSGTPTSSGTNTFTIEVSDGFGGTDTALLEIYVGPAGADRLLIGWDGNLAKAAANAPTQVADGFGGNLDGSAMQNAAAGYGSTDGTFGNFAGAGNTADTVLWSKFNSYYFDVTVENNSGADIELSSLQLDAWARLADQNSFTVTVQPGSSITEGLVATVTDLPAKGFPAAGGPNDYSDAEVDLSGLADRVLEKGGTVTFRIQNAETGTTTSQLYYDNIAVIGSSVVANPDADGDGIPDDWEIVNFGDTTSCDASSDFDGDGMSDLHEWMAGTSPTDAASALKLESAAPSSTNANVLVIQWQSVAGKSYRILCADALNGSWTTNRSAIQATAPSNTEPVTLDDDCNFFRIELEQF